MMEWRSIQTAMPAQLKQISKELLGNKDSLDVYLKKAKEYANNNPMSSTAKELVEQLEEVKKGSGDMTTALGTALRTGVISMDEFMDAIVKMNKEGSGEFQSFEEQAKNSTGGIKTSITNAKTAITRGVANIVKAFDDALKSKGLGGISTIISKTGKIAENVLKKVSSLIPAVVSKVKDIYNWVVKNQTVVKGLIGVIASLTAGYLAYKAVLIAINAIQTVKNILGTVSAFLSLIPAIKSVKDAMLLLNMAFSANPVGLVVSGITAITTALVLLKNTQTEEQKQAEEFAQSMLSAKNSMEEYNESIEQTMNQELAHIDKVSSLKDELSQLVDENGRVKEGYESRVSFILNELNGALETEYKLNGNVIEGYKNLQNEIDKTIEKKRAKIILDAEEEKYKQAIEKQEEAVNNLATAQDNLNNLLKEKNMTLEELEKYYEGSDSKEAQRVHGVIDAYNDALDTVKTYTENTKKYEDDYALYTEGKYNEISNTVTNTTSNWSNSSLEEVKNGISEQKKALDNYKQIYALTGNEIAKQQEAQAQTNLQNLADELVKRTNMVGNLGADEISAWRALAQTSTKVYSEKLEKMPKDTREKIEIATGYVANSSLPEGLAGLGSRGVSKYDSMLNLKNPTSKEISNVAGILNNDKTVSNASKILANNADKGFNDNVDGKKWGTDLSDNIAGGMKSKASTSKISGAATSIAGLIKSIIGHSVPEAGPLKDELTYMPDMIDNLVEGIDKNKYKVARATNQLAEEMKNSFDLEKINNDFMSKMDRAVAIETGSINAKVILQANKQQPMVIARDHTVKIENTQQFYSKNATPYEEQKQAKQQLRRLAYGL